MPGWQMPDNDTGSECREATDSLYFPPLNRCLSGSGVRPAHSQGLIDPPGV